MLRTVAVLLLLLGLATATPVVCLCAPSGCPHCQKQVFGAAASSLPYVECDPRGANAQPGACQAAGIRAYPTWVIGGQKIEGEVTPSELARLSGFGG